MAGNIKGITVEIGGNTTGLDKALVASNKESSALSKELREVEKALKLDPSNVEMLAQKQQLLGKSVEAAAGKLDKLREAQAQVEEQFRNGQIGEEAYRAFQREVTTAEGELKKAEKAAKDANGKFKELGEVLKSVGSAVAGVALDITKTIASAAVDFGKEVVTAYADYEQLVGGIDTLFQDSSQELQQYAANAYKTAGMSANDYMETVTSFSASLISSLGGDTEQAVEIADMAITDMSDNANKMGSDMSTIQSAYQGFAKQNYTMLDNLKLGYGGTKTEMERLLSDAQAISGVEYNLESYADVVQAIHVIQTSMDITGSTAKEAEYTISGSINSMQSAIRNLTVGFGNADADMEQLCNNVVDAFRSVVANVTPIVENIISAIPAAIGAILDAVTALLPTLLQTVAGVFSQILTTLIDLLPELIPMANEAVMTIVNAIVEAIPTLIPQTVAVITQIAQTLTDSLPMMLDAALELIKGLAQGILDAIPVLVEALPQLIQSLVDFILGSIPEIIQTGIQLLTALVQALPEIIQAIVKVIPEIIDGIITAVLGALPLIVEAGITLLIALVQALPEIITTITAAIPELISGIVDALIGNIDQIIMAGVQLFVALVENLPQIIAGIGRAIPQIIAGIVDAVTGSVPLLAEAGLQLVQGLWQGISDAGTWIKDKISGFMDGIVGGIKNFFGIKSPSALMRDQVGRYLAEGIGEGFSAEMENVSREMQRDIPTEFDLAVNTAFGKTLDDDGERSFEIVTPISLGGEKLAKVVSRVQYNTRLNRARVLGVTAN